MKHTIMCGVTCFTNCHNSEKGAVSLLSFKFAYVFLLTGITILCIGIT
jgi:hypothetical protein